MDLTPFGKELFICRGAIVAFTGANVVGAIVAGAYVESLIFHWIFKYINIIILQIYSIVNLVELS